MYAIVNAQESMQIGSGDTKEEALKDALYNIRSECYSDAEYEEKEKTLIDDLKNSENYQDHYTEWSHYIKL